MNWFWLRLVLDLLVTLGLFILLGAVVRRLRPKRVKHGITLFAPTLIALLLIIWVAVMTGPKLLDALRIPAHSETVRTVHIVEVERYQARLRASDGQSFRYDPFGPQPETGQSYSLRFLPLSYYVISFERVEAPLEQDRNLSPDPQSVTDESEEPGSEADGQPNFP
ncbi:MAG: hypothetical protein QM270_06185 [Bacillota bacterium]|nr:hypothetical protein [Bacillota bacterium]